MKRNKLLAIVILFAVVVCCTSLFFACNTGSQDSEESLRIFYDWADGSAPIEKVIKAKDVASVTSALTPPTRDGYAFIGWSLTKDGDRIVFGEDTVIADGATLYALWQYTRITLYYDLQDGSEAVEKLIEKADIKSTSQAMVTTKEGYDFAGWALAKDGDILDMDNLPAIQDGSTLYAQWKVKEYTVIFSIDEFTVVERQNVEHGKTATLPSKEAMAEYVEDGKTFVGWVYTDGTTFDVSKPITQKTVVYAVFSDVNYTVKFQNGDDIIKEVTGGVGTQIVAPLATEQPSKTGYTFSHWATKDGKKFEEGAVYKQNETYYATYTLNAPSKPSLSGNSTITYGESQTISAQINDSVAGITYSFVWSMDNDELGKGSSLTLNKLSAGKYSVRCDAIASDGTLTSATTSAQTFDFIVEKATLTATIEDINLTYGDELPDFEIKYDGFKYGETASVVTGNSEPSTNYFAGANVVDKYSVTIQGLTADNYIIVGTVGTEKAIRATITVAPKVVTLKDGIKLEASKIYDGSDYSYNFLDEDYEECFVEGLLDGHHIRVSANTKGQSNAKTYTGSELAITYSIFAGDNDFTTNYDIQISANNVTITINKADITYSASDINDLVYNGKAQQPSESFLSVNPGIGYDVYYSTTMDDIATTTNKNMPKYTNVESEAKLCFRIDAGANYNIVTDFVWVQIKRAKITFTAKGQTATYGDKTFALNQSEYTIDNADDLLIAEGEFTVTLTTTYKVGDSAFNTYSIAIDATAEHDNNFDISTEGAMLTVNKATLQVAMKDATISYGNALENVADYIDSIDGLYEGDTLSDILDAYVDSDVYERGDVVGGTYDGAITCHLLKDTDYTLNVTQKGTINVVKRVIDITFDTTTHPVSYGDVADLDFNSYPVDTNAKFFGLDYNTFLNDVVFSASTYSGKTSDVGNYSVKVSIKEDSYTDKNYAITFTNKKDLAIVVNKRYVYLVLNPATVTYGEALSDTALTYSIPEGGNVFIEGDDLNITYTHDYEAGKWGNFEWSMSVGNSNYNVEYNAVNAEIAVTARPVTISYTNNNIAQKADGKVTVTITNDMVSGGYAGDTFGGTIEIITTTKGTFSHENTNEVSIEPHAYRNGEKISEQYTFTYNINVEVKEISIYHKINGDTTTYNGKAQSPTITFDEGVTATYTYDGTTSSTMPSFTDVGTYTISYTLTQDGKTPYSSTIDFEIKKYALEIILREEHLPESINEPAFRVQFGDELNIPDTELKNYYNFSKDVWDDLGTTYAQFITDLNVQINIGYERGVTGAGTHDVKEVTWNSDFDKNFDITCDTKGQLKVTRQPIVVYGGSYTTVYGENAVAYTSGFGTHLYVYGETYDPSGSNPHFEENANEIAKLAAQYITIMPKDYTVGAWGTFDTVATCSNPNYEVKECEVMMTTTKRSVTIKADDKSIVYGESLPVLTYTASGLLDKDTLTVEFGEITLNGVGEYAIVPSVVEDEKYTITTQNGTLTVKKETLTISADAHSAITYGDDVSTFTYTATGFTNGDTENILADKISFSCTYTKGSNVGEYTFNVVCDELANYTVTIGKAQTLVVNKANYTEEQVNEALASVGTLSGTYSPSATLAGNYSITAYGFIWVDGTARPTCDVTSYTAKYCADTTNYNVYPTSVNITLNLAKANYTKAYVDDLASKITLNGTYSPTQTLDNFSLHGKDFTWADSTIVPSCDKNSVGYAATYCADTTNYNVYTDAYIKINLEKAECTLSGKGTYETDYTGNVITLADVITDITDNNTDSDKPGYTPAIKIYNTNTKVDTIIDGGVYTVTYSLDETTNYKAGSLTVTLKVKYVDYSGTLYTLEDALDKANSGTTLTVKGNGFISSNVSIPSGVTLILPCDGTYSTTAGAVAEDVDYHGGASDHAYKTQSAKYTLTILKDNTLTIDGGNIIIAGKLGKAGTGMEGHTSGSYSQITNNGNIVVNSGILDVRGYVMGTGTATFNGGSVYMPFVVRDFKGGKYTVLKAWGLTSFGDRISPFSEYEMINIQCCSVYSSNASLCGYADLYADEAHNIATIKMLASSGVIQLSSGAYMTQTFDKATGKSTLTIVGNVTIGSLSMEVEYKGITFTVKMSETFFPIPWTYDINVGDGTTATTLNISNDYKVLPGCTITIKKNATVNASDGNLIVYSNWTDNNSTASGTYNYPTKFGTAGKLLLDGGTLNAYNLGGIIYATENGGTVKASKGVSVTAKEHDGSDDYKVTESARFENGDTLTKNKTYTYNGSSWAQV